LDGPGDLRDFFELFGGRHRGGQRARRGQLRDSILVLLADQPRNGYQLMAELSQRTLGAWHPSPGAVYPCLNQLTDEDLIESVDLDGQKCFQLTEAGQRAAAEVAGEPWADHKGHPWHPEPEAKTALNELRQLGLALRTAVSTGDAVQLGAIATEVANCRRAIFAILAQAPEN
jgi:DNA-binding PadR family transcriptional regulator